MPGVGPAAGSADAVDPDLVRGVRLLCLDAGNTVIFLDHERLAVLAYEAAGFSVSGERLVVTEGEAKRLAETNGLFDCAWHARERPGAAAWGRMVGTIVLRAGMPASSVTSFLDHAWRSHEAQNLWCRVPAGLGAALDAVRAPRGDHAGVKVAIISNSEGMLDGLFRALGILGHFDAVVDSGLVGVEKPDPKIFRIAIDRYGVTPEETLHLGDMFATDILGARAAGIRSALIDPFAHYPDRHLDVPRVPGVVAVARAIDALR